MINQFAGNINNLIESINRIAQECSENFTIEKAIIDVHSAERKQLLNHFNNVEIQCFDISSEQRVKYGMVHWWFTCVDRAFGNTSSIDAVLYYPIDVNWDDTNKNTVSNPFRLCGMLKLLAQNKDKNFLIANYESSNKVKEKIEKQVRNMVLDKFPNLDTRIVRIRSEYWGISRGLFEKFKADTFINNKYYYSEDPSLYLLLYCLKNHNHITTYDLGVYQVSGTWQKKVKIQINRAQKLINEYL